MLTSNGTISRNDYERLVCRVAALEEKAGIRDQSQQLPIADELATTVAKVANDAFNIQNATCHVIDSEDESCLLVTVYVGAESVPEEMSERKAQLHQMVIARFSPSPQLRVKVVYV